MLTPLTPMEFARRSRQLYGDRLAVVDGDVRFTYDQFFSRCDRWSHVLERFGVRPGDRVAYVAPNTHAMLEAFYAVPQLGAVVVPLNYRLIGDDFAFMINHSGSRVVCVHSDFLASIDTIRAQCPDVTHWVALEGTQRGWHDYETLVAAATLDFTRAEIAETDLLTINYTSGTTARPKGVMITHRNAYLNAVGTLIHLPMTTSDRYLWTLPMFHANGWTFVWIVTAVGGTHVCLRRVDATNIFALAARERLTMLCAAPTVLIAVANAPLEQRVDVPRGLRVLTAGAPPAAATIERIEEDLGWVITHAYGLTETSPLITICEPRAEHEGLPVSDRARIKARQGVELITSGEMRVVDEHMRDVPRDGVTTGEIIVRGNVVMDGYFHDPEATTRAFMGGWFHSGDVAVVHADGYAEIRDRMKDVIISGGENISSIEVEGALLRHPAVLEVAVVGMPDIQWGETPHAFVVLRAMMSCGDDELRAFAREHLAHFKVPKHVTFVRELPKTTTGKIQKYVLRGGRVGITAQ